MSTSVAAPTKAATISDVGAMLQAYAKLVSSLQSLPVFSNDAFGYTEWMMLRLLAGEPELKAGKIANRLGLSAQRTAQILAPLRKSGYLNVSPEAGDTRKKTLTITKKGQAQLDTVDQAVLAFFEPSIKAKPRMLAAAHKFARHTVKLNRQIL